MSRIPSPQECGLPEKFDSWRPRQEDAIEAYLRSTKRAIAFSAPTGSGKTNIAVAVSLLSKKPTCIVTKTKALQKQYMDTFEEIGMVSISGRNNYTCGLREDYTCDEGYAANCPYKGTIGCPSSQAEMRAATSSLVVTNFSKWVAAKKYGQGMSHFQQVIFDEGHRAFDALCEAMQVVLHYKEIEEILGIDFLSYPEANEVAYWKPWAQMAKVTAQQKMAEAHSKISGVANPKPSWVKHYTHMRNLARRLSIVSTARATDWVCEEITEIGWQFDPIRPARYAESALLFKVPKIIVMSATLRPKSMHMIGLGKDHFDFREFDSDFDPKRCPIYYIPTMRVDARAKSLAPLWIKLDQIAAKRRDRNGMINTISHQRREDIVGLSRFSDSMIFNDKDITAAEAIEKFKGTYPGAILVSPSVEEGYDFPGKELEWIFTCKIPFEPPSKIVKAREANDPEYRGYQAMQRLVQGFGRGMRSKIDQTECFCCDEHLSWFLPRYSHLAPKSFHGFFREVSVVPPPPPRLK